MHAMHTGWQRVRVLTLLLLLSTLNTCEGVHRAESAAVEPIGQGRGSQTCYNSNDLLGESSETGVKPLCRALLQALSQPFKGSAAFRTACITTLGEEHCIELCTELAWIFDEVAFQQQPARQGSGESYPFAEPPEKTLRYSDCIRVLSP